MQELKDALAAIPHSLSEVTILWLFNYPIEIAPRFLYKKQHFCVFVAVIRIFCKNSIKYGIFSRSVCLVSEFFLTKKHYLVLKNIYFNSSKAISLGTWPFLPTMVMPAMTSREPFYEYYILWPLNGVFFSFTNIRFWPSITIFQNHRGGEKSYNFVKHLFWII